MRYNLVLNLAICAWAIAQVLKFLITLATEHEVNWEHIWSSGGMPSSHSAFVCASAASMAELYGVESPYFAISAVLAVIVMYDASNVRRATGEQARILNYMMEHWSEMKPELFGKELKVLLGHTPLQVAMGALLGIAVGLAGTALFR